MSGDNSGMTADQKKSMATSLFNATWDLLDKDDRTEEDDNQMVHAAHASRFFWGEIGTPLEHARGEWQISRVYSTLKRSEPAIHHAHSSLKLCEANGITDFDLAFAYEALARAYSVAGDGKMSHSFAEKARTAAEQIEDEGNRDYFLKELSTI